MKICAIIIIFIFSLLLCLTTRVCMQLETIEIPACKFNQVKEKYDVVHADVAATEPFLILKVYYRERNKK